MKIRFNKLKKITGYILSITISFILSVYFYQLLINIHYYYLFVTIPVLFLFITCGLFSLIKLLITLFSMNFEKNDNDEILEFFNKLLTGVNQLFKYTLVAIFISLLSATMFLDILLCLTFEKYFLLSVSVVIWLLMYYIVFCNVKRIITNEKLL